MYLQERTLQSVMTSNRVLSLAQPQVNRALSLPQKMRLQSEQPQMKVNHPLPLQVSVSLYLSIFISHAKIHYLLQIKRLYRFLYI